MLTLEQLGILFGIVSSMIAIFHVVFVSGTKLAKVEERTNIMWEFLMRRAMSEAVQKGLATMNSPLTVTPQAMSMFDALRDELQGFYSRLGKTQSTAELMLEIERRFGDRILKEICIPNGLSGGECLVIAAAVAKGDAVVTLQETESQLDERISDLEAQVKRLRDWKHSIDPVQKQHVDVINAEVARREAALKES